MANTKKTGVRIIAFTIAAGMVLGTVSAPAFADEIVAVTEDGQIAIEEPLQEYQDVEVDQDEYVTADQYQQELPENEEEEAIPQAVTDEEALPQEDLEEEDTDEDSVEDCTEECIENEMDPESDSEEALPVADEENEQLHSEESGPDDVRYAEGFWGEWEYYEEYKESWYGECDHCRRFVCEPDEEEVQEKDALIAYEKSLAGHDLDEAEDIDEDEVDEDYEDEEDYDDEYDEESDEEEEESDSDNGWWKKLEMKEERLDFTR